MTSADQDRIEKIIELRAPRARVWRALSTPSEFASWFGLGEPLKLVGTFEAGARIDGVWQVDGREKRELFCTIEQVEPERLLAFRWVPYEVPDGEDPARHPTTRIEMRLEDTEHGTRLSIVESGFASLPADKQYTREQNGRGWAVQIQAIAQQVVGRIEVAVEQTIARPPAEVFDAIVDPAKMVHYFISRASGRLEAGKQIEWEWSDVGAKLAVQVLAIDDKQGEGANSDETGGGRPRKISFVWSATGLPTKVLLVLEADGEHTKLVAKETPFPLTDDGAKRAMQQTQGWTNFACCLKAYLEHAIDLRHGKQAAGTKPHVA